jgi:hypothetical protein
MSVWLLENEGDEKVNKNDGVFLGRRDKCGFEWLCFNSFT